MGCNAYNGMVEGEELVEQSWANVETQYQRRTDLIPNLVSTVRGAANFEQETLQAVTQARAEATSIRLTVDDLEDPARLREFEAAQSRLAAHWADCSPFPRIIRNSAPRRLSGICRRNSKARRTGLP